MCGVSEDSGVLSRSGRSVRADMSENNLLCCDSFDKRFPVWCLKKVKFNVHVIGERDLCIPILILYITILVLTFMSLTIEKYYFHRNKTLSQALCDSNFIYVIFFCFCC